GAGAYVVWRCAVGLLGSGAGGAEVEMAKRYSEFDALHIALVRAFPHAVAMIPALPRKSLVSRFRPHFLESRRAGLQHFLSCVLLNPEFAASPILKDFVFS
ncbi:Phox-like protein, partial [Dissoconium aciculare CBS 342.82]|uniref:Endosomal/vacuolar adapter protein YPT35 n=1 Tax=Dissoconium aciculare CBS 342.82 TaxID=1314786 RepID=A0A6J3LR39_9PEZI